MSRILITAASTVAAQKVQRLFQGEIVLADQEKLPAFAFPGRQVVQIPEGDHASFAHVMLTLCLDALIDSILPLKRNEQLALAEAKVLFEEYNIQLLVPDKDFMAQTSHSNALDHLLVVDQGKVNGQLQYSPNLSGVFHFNAAQELSLLSL